MIWGDEECPPFDTTNIVERENSHTKHFPVGKETQTLDSSIQSPQHKDSNSEKDFHFSKFYLSQNFTFNEQLEFEPQEHFTDATDDSQGQIPIDDTVLPSVINLPPREDIPPAVFTSPANIPQRSEAPTERRPGLRSHANLCAPRRMQMGTDGSWK